MTKYFKCSCGMEIISVEKDDNFIFISIYKQNSRLPWFYRFRHIWHILRYGEPYSDEVVLSFKDATELANTIKEQCE